MTVEHSSDHLKNFFVFYEDAIIVLWEYVSKEMISDIHKEYLNIS